ncbi:MAG: exopolysaccharide biosynthesis polyprenyl glycosylphosphotransferase [Planctomycetota bacterium]
MIRTRGGERAFLLAADLAIVCGAFAAAYALRFRLGLLALTEGPTPAWSDYARALPVVALVFVLVLRAWGLYRDVLARGIDAFERTVEATTLASLIVLAASFFDRSFSYSRAVFLLLWAQCLLLLPLPRLLLQRRRRRAYARGEDLLPALIVGTTPRARDLLVRLGRHSRYGLAVRGLIAVEPQQDGEEREEQRADPPRVWGHLRQLEQVLVESGARELLLAHDLERLPLFELLETCERLGVEVRMVPHTLDLFVTASDLGELFGVPFVSIREDRAEALSLALKRAFDLGLGLALSLLTLPLIGALALLIRREDGAPALLRQRRVGRGGEVFGMWKLRSMVPDAEDRLHEFVDLDAIPEPIVKLPEDPRVTRLGRLLRRWSLDELPQLWNVVWGDMSLVGPRPEVEVVVARYDARHRRRLKAKPGITGLQQLEARGAQELEERIRLDVYYTRRRTFLFDLWILARTPAAVVKGRGAI